MIDEKHVRKIAKDIPSYSFLFSRRALTSVAKDTKQLKLQKKLFDLTMHFQNKQHMKSKKEDINMPKETLILVLDAKDKSKLQQWAKVRGVSVSDYVVGLNNGFTSLYHKFVKEGGK